MFHVLSSPHRPQYWACWRFSSIGLKNMRLFLSWWVQLQSWTLWRLLPNVSPSPPTIKQWEFHDHFASWCWMQGCWFYSLLACLEKPLLPEAHSSIRQLARRCAQLRSTLASRSAPPVNLCQKVLVLLTLELFYFFNRKVRGMKHYLPSTCSSVWLPGIQLILATSSMRDWFKRVLMLHSFSFFVSGRYFEQNDLADQPEWGQGWTVLRSDLGKNRWDNFTVTAAAAAWLAIFTQNCG